MSFETHAAAAVIQPDGKIVAIGNTCTDRSCDFALVRYLSDTVTPILDPINDAQFFVHQHFLDFLNREPDTDGLAFWTNEITSCGADAQCIDVKRINVSAAFFLSIEFQNTGYLVERMYKAAYGDATESSTGLTVPIVRRAELTTDSAIVGQGVVVNSSGWEQKLDANKQAYSLAFVQRQRFIDAYPPDLAPDQFVAKLNLNIGNLLTQDETNALVAELSMDPSAIGRAKVLLKVAENSLFDSREKNRAFVLMQYFGYLRRDPDSAPDSNYSGYQFWLSKLDQFGGDFHQAEMVKAFIESTEYRQRFLQTSTEVSLRDFGAVGDGLTNDAPALQQALDSLADAGGGTLVVPTGRYLLQTPVIKQFTAGQRITITGAPSATPINVGGNGDGLDLTSEFIIAIGEDNVALQLLGPASLLMTDIGFVGVSSALTDARVVLSLVGVDEATIRHCEFYGLASLVAGGAILAADHTDLKLQQTAFLGCATNSGVQTSVVQNTSWYGVSVNDCKFVDYGRRAGFYSKTPLAAPYSWVMIGNEAPPKATSSRREAILDHVFLDEGAFMATTVRPDLYGGGNLPNNVEVYFSRLYVNVTNLGASSIFINGARKVFIERSHLGWSHNCDKAILLTDVGEAILDQLDLSGDATTIGANAERLTIINSPYTSLDSTGPYTRVFTTETLATDPAEHVRQQYLSIVTHEPDRVEHFYWTNRLLHCELDGDCIREVQTALSSFLARTLLPVAP